MSEMIPLGSWVDQSVHYLLDHDAATFDAIGRAIEGLAALIEHGLQAVPMWLMMAFFIGIGLWRVGWRFALFTTLSLLLIFATGFWIRPSSRWASRCRRRSSASCSASRSASGPRRANGSPRSCARSWT